MNAHHSWDAARYDDRASFVSDLGRDLLELLAVRPGERILDLGCGTGTLTAEIARQGGVVVGIDSAETMLDQARARYPALSFQLGDGQELSFEARFDAVFSNAALHWMVRAEETAQGIARALVPGGRLVAELGGHGCVARVRRAVADALAELGDRSLPRPEWYFPRLGEYTSLLERVGLAPRYAVLFERPTQVVGEDGLAAWLGVFAAPLLEALGTRRVAFLGEVERRARPELYRDGKWVLDYVRLRLMAVR